MYVSYLQTFFLSNTHIFFSFLIIQKELGQGAYGKIFMATLNNSNSNDNNNDKQVVAVKQITTTLPEELVTAFNDWRHEVALMVYV